MRHIFIINPAAGNGAFQKTFTPEVEKLCLSRGVDFTVHITTGVGDAERYTRDTVTGAGHDGRDEVLRFYACGGDGTLCEVVNGALGCPYAEVAHIPAGTGNDFARNFVNPEYLRDLDRQLDGNAQRIDIIACNGRYGANMYNVGFDCDVAAQVGELKKNKLIPGGMAYIAGIVRTLTRHMGKKMRLRLCLSDRDGDETVIDRELLLVAIANGSFCGGGFKAAPRASLCDGLMDVCIVERIGRMKFISMVKFYKEGTHLDNSSFKKIITYLKCKKLQMLFDEQTDVCVDGEIIRSNSLSFEILPLALPFVVPAGCEFTDNGGGI